MANNTRTVSIEPGTRYGKLTVLNESASRGYQRFFLCKCECGNVKEMRMNGLKHAGYRSCGCAIGKAVSKNFTTHGQSETRLYYIWQNMTQRCCNENNHTYKWYGAKGIQICEEWKDFRNFYDWAHCNGYSDTLTIERKDVTKNYEPANCTWIPNSEQSSNTSRTIKINYNGESKSLKEWAREFGINPSIIRQRLSKNWTIEKAFTTKPKNPLLQTTGQ